MKTNLMTIMFIIVLTLTMKQYCEQHWGAVSFMDSEVVKEEEEEEEEDERMEV